MKISILKRLDAVESQIIAAQQAAPSMIMIWWNPESQDFTVSERFYKSTGKKILPGMKERSLHIRQLNEYCISPHFNGVLILDTVEAPEQYGGNLYSLDAKIFKRIRKECGKNAGIMIDSITAAAGEDVVISCMTVIFS